MAESGLVQLAPGTQVYGSPPSDITPVNHHPSGLLYSLPDASLSNILWVLGHVPGRYPVGPRGHEPCSQVERWTIMKKLGEGGFGAVYKVSGMGGEYAFKVEGVNEQIQVRAIN